MKICRTRLLGNCFRARRTGNGQNGDGRRGVRGSDNEGTHEKPGGFWLINEKNEKQPLWHTHQHYFTWAKKHIDDIKQRTGKAITDAEFRAAALEYLRR